MTRRLLLLLCILGFSSSAFAQTWSTVSLATKDLAYSPLTQRLYATTPANNSVQEIDPFTGTLLRSLFVGSQPNKLAVSDTGSHLYVGLDGAAAVARINLATFTVDLQFPVGVDPFDGPLLPHDLAVQPGNPNVLAVVRKPGNSSATRGVAIFDSGVIRPATTSDFYRVTDVEFSATPSRLYGLDDFTTALQTSARLTVDGTGVTLDDSVGSLIQGYCTDIRFDAGRIYGSDGRVIDPEARQLLGTFPLAGSYRTLVAPNSASGAVHFITPGVRQRNDPSSCGDSTRPRSSRSTRTRSQAWWRPSRTTPILEPRELRQRRPCLSHRVQSTGADSYRDSGDPASVPHHHHADVGAQHGRARCVNHAERYDWRHRVERHLGQRSRVHWRRGRDRGMVCR